MGYKILLLHSVYVHKWKVANKPEDTAPSAERIIMQMYKIIQSGSYHIVKGRLLLFIIDVIIISVCIRLNSREMNALLRHVVVQ